MILKIRIKLYLGVVYNYTQLFLVLVCNEDEIC